MKKTAAGSGYRMPAEWAPHAATWLAFPHHRTDFPGKLSAVIHTFAEAARVISQGERVRLLVRDESEEKRALSIFEDAGVTMKNLDVIRCDTNRSWLRDTMPIWVTKRNARPSKVAVNFRFNGWARYRDHEKDDAAGRFVSQRYSKSWSEPRDEQGERIVLEGGSIDIDASGTLLTTDECLVTSPRARFGSHEEAERALRTHLGVKKIIWLPDGIAGDDTSGHVDDFARFAPKNRVLVCDEPNRRDVNHQPLQAAQAVLSGCKSASGKRLEVVKLPMPDPVVYRGERLPASYANFYVSNAAVLVPVFNDRHDQEALSIVAQCFPDRPTVGIYARDLVVGLGTLHCSTMQEPV